MKRLILSLILLLTFTLGFSAIVGMQTVQRVAGNFVLERLGTSYSVQNSTPLDSGYNNSYIYVVNLKPKGFVLIAADDAATPIIGYSTHNDWNEYAIPEQMQYMLKNWNDQMHAIVTRNLNADFSISSQWNKYNKDSNSFVPVRDLRDVSPLINSVWGQ